MRASRLLSPLLVLAAVLVAAGLASRRPGPARGSSAVAEISLPAPATTGRMSVEGALAKRRSVRAFSPQELTLAQIGQLCWAAQGITEKTRGLRTAPSAGALYPIEIYLVKRDGVFHYLPQEHRLARHPVGGLAKLSGADRRAALADQAPVRSAPLDIVIVGVHQRTAKKYGARAERYVLLEAGHVAQNLHLQAVALGLGSVSVGAFEDERVSRALSLPAEESPLYIIPIGHPARRG